MPLFELLLGRDRRRLLGVTAYRRAADRSALMAEHRRFPPAWPVEETDVCLIVYDGYGQAITYACDGGVPLPIWVELYCMADDDHIAQLNKGRHAWNAWRYENPNIRPDLSELDPAAVRFLTRNFYQTSFMNADLRGADFSGAVLREADLRGAVLTGTNLSGADLSGADLSGANLFKAEFDHATLWRRSSLRCTVLGRAPTRRASAMRTQRYEALAAEKVHAWLVPSLPTSPALVLDIGAGSGRDAAWLVSRGLEVVAIEPSAGMLAEAQRLHPSPSIRWLSDSLPSIDKVLRLGLSFDMILLSAVWMHVQPRDRPRAFRKLIALLKPGGCIAVTLRQPIQSDRGMHDVSQSGIEQLAALMVHSLRLRAKARTNSEEIR
jgi:2-polyprenyl-3-methyl-5-hydroxy-6-metoxy-1,4-benzoquinol methylase